MSNPDVKNQALELLEKRESLENLYESPAEFFTQRLQLNIVQMTTYGYFYD